MSGHSKWSTIKHKKAANDAAKSGVFTKIAGAITVAVRTGGGGDPDSNFALRLAISKARAVNMPKERIEKAIDKGMGKGGEEEVVELVIEGYGPGGAAIIVTAVTDNRNRTVAEIKNVLEKNGGRMGEPGSVLYQFDRVGMVRVSKAIKEEHELELIDMGARDVGVEDMVGYVITEVEDLQKTVESLHGWGYPEVEGEIGYKAKNEMQPMVNEPLDKLMELLLDHADVQEVYSNI